MSHGYFGEHFYSEWFTMAVAWSTATGQDWVSRCDFAAHAPEYYLYHYRPWGADPSVLHIGVNAMCGHWEALTPAKFEGENLAVLAAARFRDGVGQGWVDEVLSKIPMGWSRDSAGRGAVWGKLLWYDPDLPPVLPKDLPPSRLFPENGHAVMRSDWTPDATVALFRCGRFGEIDGHWGRNNADNLHFLIERKGVLAADTGAVHSLNNAALGFAGAREHRDDLIHITEYARQTVAHNAITVGSGPLVLRDYRGAPLAIVQRGGQSPIQDASWWPLWGLPAPKPSDRPFREGRIVAYETSPLFDYAAGDATYSYPPTRVKSITRQFVYLRPDTFVVFDRVAAAGEGQEMTWMLHALYEPAWNGTTAPDGSLPPERQFVIDADGKGRLPNPKPGGRRLHAGGDTFTIDDRWPGMTGRLYAKILLPREEERVVRTVGGAWHDFEVDGVNYGPTEATYAKHQGGRNEHNRENTLGVEGWRIELSPRGAPAATTFLAVLVAADQSADRMPPAERIEVEGRPGARVTLGGRTCEVTFTTAGPVGGRIRIVEGGRTLADRALADTVEDHYGKWSADPRYAAWMTRPEYRSFIGAGEKH
jgi:heparin/heparan-sulfate lyase